MIFVEEGLFDFLPPSADDSEGLPRRVRRRWLLAAQREAGCGAVVALLLFPCCCCCCARRTRAALDLGNAAAGETGKDCLLSPVRAAFTAKAVSFLLCFLKIMCLYGG